VSTCVDAGRGDVCTESGTCGCSNDAVCVVIGTKFDGGVIAWEP